jgi:FKBP-type peptidyl-prolyl cis-trans isomerase FkpA
VKKRSDRSNLAFQTIRSITSSQENIMLTRVLALTLLALAFGCSPISKSSGPGPEDADAPKEFTTTESGLKYRILRRGTGAKPTAQSFVTVDYAGWLDNGQEFDSSYNRRESASFNLSGVVPGWTEGLQLVGEGGMIELEIPSELGYGPMGSPGTIPPNATLHFKVELHDVSGG